MRQNKWCLLLFLLVGVGMPCHAIQKCMDNNGVVSFQDKPCAANEKSEILVPKADKDSKNLANLIPLYAKIPGVGTAVLFYYRWWSVYVTPETPDIPTTIRMTSKPGEERLSFSINFFANTKGKRLSVDEAANVVVDLAQPFVADSVEQEVLLEKLSSTIGTVVYGSFNELKYQNAPIPDNEYSSVTVGYVSHPKVIVGFTILTNGTAHSKALDEALNIIASFIVRESGT